MRPTPELPLVLTLNDLAAVLQVTRRTLERRITLQRRTGIRLLPTPIAGFGWRFRRQDVEHWLRVGAPGTRRAVA